MSAIVKLPSYDELPETGDGRARSAWGLFGPSDSLGMMNLITPEKTLAALTLPTVGEVFQLNLPLNFFDPPLYKRAPLEHEIILTRGGRGMEEVFSGFNTQASSQWDSLAHVSYQADTFYNGATLDDVLKNGRNTLDHLARRGIATRGVLLDLKRTAELEGWDYDPGSSHAFTPDKLERARIAAGIEYEPGDIIILRSGFTQWYRTLDEAGRITASAYETLRAAGVEHTEAMARYLWNTHAAAFAGDAPSFEVWPSDHAPELYPFGLLHQMILAQFGQYIGELWFVDDLADWCAAHGRNEFLLTSTPMLVPGSVASPANVLAIV